MPSAGHDGYVEFYLLVHTMLTYLPGQVPLALATYYTAVCSSCKGRTRPKWLDHSGVCRQCRKAVPGAPSLVWTGHKLRLLRQTLRAPLWQMAEIAGVCAGTVQEWEMSMVPRASTVGRYIDSVVKCSPKVTKPSPLARGVRDGPEGLAQLLGWTHKCGQCLLCYPHQSMVHGKCSTCRAKEAYTPGGGVPYRLALNGSYLGLYRAQQGITVGALARAMQVRRGAVAGYEKSAWLWLSTVGRYSYGIKEALAERAFGGRDA